MDIKERFAKAMPSQRELGAYFRMCLNKSLELIVLTIVVILIYIIILYILNMVWRTYLSTPVGMEFIGKFQEIYLNVEYFLSGDPIDKSISISIKGVFICLGVSIISKIFHIARYLYFSMGFLGRIIVWGLPLTIFTAWVYGGAEDLQYLLKDSLLSFFPVMCIFMSCFNFSNSLFPEISDIIKFIDGIRYEKHLF